MSQSSIFQRDLDPTVTSYSVAGVIVILEIILIDRWFDEDLINFRDEVSSTFFQSVTPFHSYVLFGYRHHVVSTFDDLSQ